MRVRWRGFELPTRVVMDEETRSETYGKFITEPFERGFGTTVGNSLRRVLLGSLEGAAVTSLKFEGIQHEFTTIPGVYEDVTDIVLNSKQLLVKLTGADAATLKIDVRKQGPILAKDIEHDHTIEIVNPDLHIATLTEEGHFRCEMQVKRGRGYRTAEENAPGPEQEIGVIPVASFFSPVRRVKFKTEYTRVGQLTNYDKLILEVWTNGTVTPEMALVEASKILRKHLNPFINYFDVGKELAAEAGADIGTMEEAGAPAGEPGVVKEVKVNAEAAYHQLMLPIQELDLTVRAMNCLEGENIQTIGDLCRRTEDDLLKLRNFGRTTLNEIKKKLEDRDLKLGMDVDAILAR
ncbi:MAG TPA: DNA-directed RNA polymerase subunit alpha [Planctomycetota bacterium]|nr:DNA-directed RNA polymerase subunit alpha [Planctomycetota bacterium]